MGTGHLFTHYDFSVHSGALFLTTGVALAVAYGAWRRRGARGAVYVALLELAVAEWAFAVAFEVAAREIPLKVMWSQVSYVGVASSPVLFFLFAVTFGEWSRHLSRGGLALLWVVPAATVVIAATNGWHHLLWPDVLLNEGSQVAIFVHGAWFWVCLGYSYCLYVVGVISLCLAVLRFPAFYMRQAGVLVLGSALPIAGNVLYVFGPNPMPGVDWTPIAFALTGLITFWGMSRLRILDLMPVARDKLVETMSDGVLVLDAQGRIVDVNGAMEAIIGRPAKEVVGQPGAEVVRHWQALVNGHELGAEARMEVGLGEGAGVRQYDVRLSPLHDANGGVAGQLVVSRDITASKRLEEERTRLVEELQEALGQVKTLRGLLPICAYCKKVRDDQGYWHEVEAYVTERSDAEFSHSLCPDCAQRLYPRYPHRTE